MNEVQGPSRRSMLYAAAVMAGSAVLAGCSSGDTKSSGGDGKSGGGSGKNTGPAKGKGSATKPLTPPATLSEAPSIAALVKAGKLPALKDRLPEHPYVLPHNWVTSGKYGGRLNLVDMTTAGGTYGSVREYMYGFSPLRWLNDGQSVGPGLAESFESNADATQWTLHFRKGLKWSDGQPWTTADVMFWWEDWTLYQGTGQVPPDELRSGSGKVAKLEAPDAQTLVITFDKPAPLLAEQVAAYANGGDGGNGRIWSMPKHYLKQFHPKYTPSVGEDWASASGDFVKKYLFATNPDCPTMTGWKLKSLKEGSSMVWERNPYYYEVDKEGKQLPYVDEVRVTLTSDQQVALLQIQTGKVDFAHCAFLGVGLSEYAGIKSSSGTSNTTIQLWNSGSGTGQMFFLNYDYQDPKLRKLFREPKFRQALSHAVDRSKIKKAIYFNQGTPTTGTASPMSSEFNADEQGKQDYEKWRTSYLKYDPDKAKQLLDELNVKDTDGDGWRELPDGSKLSLEIDYPADEGPDAKKVDAYMEKDWKAIGLNAKRVPIPPTSFDDQWTSGKLMGHTNWEVANVGSNLVQPYWIVPIESARWAPLEGQYYAVRGSAQEQQERNVDPYKRHPPRMEPEKGGPIERMWKFYDQAKAEPDPVKRSSLVWQLLKIHIDEGPFFQGSVANYPQLEVHKQDLRNVPTHDNLALGGLTNPWGHPTPAVYDPECFYWDDPGKHGAGA